MKTITGNIIDIEQGIICHQVNCQRVAGAGLAKQIREMWPSWYRFFRYNSSGYKTLGDCSLYTLKDKALYLASLYAQGGYGRHERQTDYAAFESCLAGLRKNQDTHPALFFKTLSVYFPYKIGCGLAGGDWAIIEPLIEKYFPEAVIVRRPK